MDRCLIIYGYNFFQSIDDDIDPSHSVTHNRDILRDKLIKDPPELESTEDDNTCINCGEIDCLSLDYESDSVICNICGTINYKESDNKLYYSYKEFDVSGYTSRCGATINKYLPKSSVNVTLINNKTKNYKHFWNSGVPYKEKKLIKIFKIINNMCYPFLNAKIIDDAKDIFFKTSDEFVKKENRTGLIAACVHMSCRKNGVRRTDLEIRKIFDIDKTHLTYGKKKLLEFIGSNENVSQKQIKEIQGESAKPDDFVIRFCSNLGITSNKFTLKVSKIIEIIKDNNLIENKKPAAIAASVILFLCKKWNIKMTKKMIKAGCGISAVTISQCYKKLVLNQKFLV